MNEALRDIFLSTDRMADLSSIFRINVIQQLAPDIYKDSYLDQNTTNHGFESRDGPYRPHRDTASDLRPEAFRPFPLGDDPSALPRQPVPHGDFPPPVFEDEHEMNKRPQRLPAQNPERRPLNIGERDLYPPGMGPHDPLAIRPGGGPGGGMHPTLDDPLFGAQGGYRPYDPAAPPGARYDPVGPGDRPPSGRLPGGNPFNHYGNQDFI